MPRVLTCPYPDSLSPLSLNGFMLTINKLPGVSFWAQTIDIPPISMPGINIPNPLTRLYVSSSDIDYGELKVEFLVDEKMANYRALYRWFRGLGFPTGHDERLRFENEETNDINTTTIDSSDGSVIILNSSNNPTATFKFIDLIPTSMSGATLTTKTQDVQYLSCSASFRYTYYDIE